MNNYIITFLLPNECKVARSFPKRCSPFNICKALDCCASPVINTNLDPCNLSLPRNHRGQRCLWNLVFPEPVTSFFFFATQINEAVMQPCNLMNNHKEDCGKLFHYINHRLHSSWPPGKNKKNEEEKDCIGLAKIRYIWMLRKCAEMHYEWQIREKIFSLS